MKKCKENWKEIPFTSEHIWKADFHHAPYGDCEKCGLNSIDYNNRLIKKAEEMMKKHPELFIKDL